MLRLEAAFEITERNQGRCVQGENVAHLLCHALVLLLAVGVTRLRVPFHYDPRIGAVHPGLP